MMKLWTNFTSTFTTTLPIQFGTSTKAVALYMTDFSATQALLGRLSRENGDRVVLLSDSSHHKMHRGIFISLLNRYSPVVTIKVPMIENTRDVDLNIAIKTLADRLLSLTKLDKFNLKRNRVAFCEAFESLSLIDFYLQKVPLIYAFRKTYITIINH